MFKALIINLVHRTDRKTHILKEIEKLPLESHEIVEGIIDGSGTCFQSQKKCVQIAKDRCWDHVLILEDDCIFTNNLEDVLRGAWEQVNKKEWKMFFWGANLQAPAIWRDENLLELSGAYAAHAYVVHHSFYDIILNLPFDREMDVHYRELMETYPIFLCNPMVAYQIPSFSDLQGRVRDYNDEINYNFSRYADPQKEPSQ